MRDSGLEPLSTAWSQKRGNPCRNARRSIGRSTGCRHLHRGQARVGAAPGRRSAVRDLLQSRRAASARALRAPQSPFGAMTAERTWTAALVVIGDEILSGRTQDKNVAQVATWLNEQGIRLAEV